MWKKSRKKQDGNLGDSVSSNDLLNEDVNETVAQITEALGNSSDLRIRFIKNGDNPTAFAVIHIDGITNTQKINEHIINPLLAYQSHKGYE